MFQWTAVPDPFLQVPQNQTALIDRNVTFTCTTKEVAGTIRWVKGNKPPSSEIKDEVGRYGILYLPGGVSELHIYNVQFSDEDVYRCYVGYTFKEPDLTYSEANLIVQCKHDVIISLLGHVFVNAIPRMPHK